MHHSCHGGGEAPPFRPILGKHEGTSDVIQQFGHHVARHFGIGVRVDGLQDREVKLLIEELCFSTTIARDLAQELDR